MEPKSETEASFFKDDYQFFRAIVGTYAKLTDILLVQQQQSLPLGMDVARR